MKKTRSKKEVATTKPDTKSIEKKADDECLKVILDDSSGESVCSLVVSNNNPALSRSTGCNLEGAAKAVIEKGLHSVTGDCKGPQAHKQRGDDYLALVAELNPQNAYEGMLVSQMVLVHFQALDCFKRASINKNSSVAFERLQNQGVKLLKVFNQQIATLDKHRLRGKQTMTVEHFHVHKGGQAIVGDVHQGVGG